MSGPSVAFWEHLQVRQPLRIVWQRAGLPEWHESLEARFRSLSCSDQPLQIHHKLGILGHVRSVLAAECLI